MVVSQITPHLPSTETLSKVNLFVDEPNQNVDRYSEKNDIDYSSPLMLEEPTIVQSTKVIDAFYPIVEIDPDLLVIAVQNLIDLVEKDDNHHLDSLTEVHYQKLVDILDNLIITVGSNEDHILASIMDFIGTLIENYEDKHVPEITVV